MVTAGNPFISVDKQTVIGTLKAARSSDPDVLHAQRTELLTSVKFPKLAGNWVMFLGGMISLTIIGAVIGIPMLVVGWWLRQRGSRNIAAVEAGYSEYLKTLPA